MAIKTAKVVLGGDEYEVHKLNVGELEEVVDILENTAKARVPFAILRIALKRATPAVPDAGAIEAEPAEVRDAVVAILALSGMTPTIAAPGE